MPRKVLQGTVLLQPLWLISETDVRALPHFPVLEGPPVMVSSNVAVAWGWRPQQTLLSSCPRVNSRCLESTACQEAHFQNGLTFIP